MLDTNDWSARKKLKHSLLKRAFEENRGPEVILLIQWRTAMVNHKTKVDEAAIEKARENVSQPRALRALNLVEEMNGRNVRYTRYEQKITAKDVFKLLAEMPMEQRIIHRDPYEGIIAKTPALHADLYDPMDGLQIVTGYSLACRDYAAIENLSLSARAPTLKH